MVIFSSTSLYSFLHISLLKLPPHFSSYVNLPQCSLHLPSVSHPRQHSLTVLIPSPNKSNSLKSTITKQSHIPLHKPLVFSPYLSPQVTSMFLLYREPSLKFPPPSLRLSQLCRHHGTQRAVSRQQVR